MRLLSLAFAIIPVSHSLVAKDTICVRILIFGYVPPSLDVCCALISRVEYRFALIIVVIIAVAIAVTISPSIAIVTTARIIAARTFAAATPTISGRP